MRMYMEAFGEWVTFEEYSYYCETHGYTTKTERIFPGGWPVFVNSNGEAPEVEY